jgi:glycosyltransferase involved in cell wall biosynthesis
LEIHQVKALPSGLTRKIGLGNLGIRSYPYLKEAVDRYLGKHQIDLIYFSTTVFVSLALGPHWKRKFGVPFVIDLQDPWRNDFHLTTPRRERPRKFWFEYRLYKFLEARTMPECSGIIAVSSKYIDMISERYPETAGLPCLTLPFGALALDFQIAASLPGIRTNHDVIDVVYIGRGGSDMYLAVEALFTAFRTGLDNDPAMFSRVHFTFIGTSYAATGKGNKTIEPMAQKAGIVSRVTEITDRLPYYQSLKRLQEADLLFMPGSTDTSYTASKLYPYILAQKPILAFFNEQSSVVDILGKTRAGEVVTFRSDEDVGTLSHRVLPVVTALLEKLPYQPATDWDAFEPYTAREMTRKQCEFFDAVKSER